MSIILWVIVRKVPSVYTKDHNGNILLFAVAKISHIILNYNDIVLLCYHQTFPLCQGGHRGYDTVMHIACSVSSVRSSIRFVSDITPKIIRAWEMGDTK